MPTRLIQCTPYCFVVCKRSLHQLHGDRIAGGAWLTHRLPCKWTCRALAVSMNPKRTGQGSNGIVQSFLDEWELWSTGVLKLTYRKELDAEHSPQCWLRQQRTEKDIPISTTLQLCMTLSFVCHPSGTNQVNEAAGGRRQPGGLCPCTASQPHLCKCPTGDCTCCLNQINAS